MSNCKASTDTIIGRLMVRLTGGQPVQVPRGQSRMSRGAIGLLVAVAVAGASFPVAAETKTPRVAVQFGLTYLPMILMKHHKLIEKQAATLGIQGVEAQWATYSSGGAMNDALLSNSLDFASLGTPPLLMLWDRTRGNIDVRGVAGFSALPQYLVTNNPNVKTLRDFTDADRIALPAVKVSIQAILLQMAAAKEFGPKQFDKLDQLTVSMGHPDAYSALVSGRSQITAHFSNPPFQQLALENPKFHRVLSSIDVLDGSASNGVIAATSKFRTENPIIFKAFIAALDEANDMISKDPHKAAVDFVKETKSKLDVEWVFKLLTSKDTEFTSVPLNTKKYGDFMYERGTIRNKMGSWQDLFFPEIHNRNGS